MSNPTHSRTPHATLKHIVRIPDACLVSVAELLVLPVRHVGPCLGGHVGILLLTLRRAPLVLPDVVQEQNERDHGTSGLGGHDGDLGGAELGFVLLLEGLGADDVAEGEGSTDNGGGESTLSGATNVGHNPLGIGMLTDEKTPRGIGHGLRCKKWPGEQLPR